MADGRGNFFFGSKLDKKRINKQIKHENHNQQNQIIKLLSLQLFK
jgi:hypothetical protein